jgi:hypothetical protein
MARRTAINPTQPTEIRLQQVALCRERASSPKPTPVFDPVPAHVAPIPLWPNPLPEDVLVVQLLD